MNKYIHTYLWSAELGHNNAESELLTLCVRKKNDAVAMVESVVNLVKQGTARRPDENRVTGDCGG